MVYGVIDIQSAGVFERELERAQAGDEQLVLDLDGLSFMDSSALQLLVRASQRAGEQGRKVILQRVPRAARRLLEITGMNALFTIVE
jgi:anti-sigma B factor antagonist